MSEVLKFTPPEKQKELTFIVLGSNEKQTPMKTTVQHYFENDRSYFVLEQDANKAEDPPDTIILEADDISRIYHMLKGH